MCIHHIYGCTHLHTLETDLNPGHGVANHYKPYNYTPNTKHPTSKAMDYSVGKGTSDPYVLVSVSSPCIKNRRSSESEDGEAGWGRCAASRIKLETKKAQRRFT
jgi:hypothetical protein